MIRLTCRALLGPLGLLERAPADRIRSNHSALWIVLLALCWLPASLARGDDGVDFGRRIRPLLAEKCFQCHGLDEEQRASDLRLDLKDGLFGAIESGDRAVTPGDPEKSLIYRRLITDDEDERMPPLDSKKRLTVEQIELVKQWIEQGAAWQQHWSLVTPRRPSIPQVGDSRWPRNEIDHFVLARLEKEGLGPSRDADPVTLLRRVTFDLTGLPPTLEETDAFLDDAAGRTADQPKGTGVRSRSRANLPHLDAAYERVVERLLVSPRYGEHMGRYWLDAARYGDTHGLHLDNFRLMWPYRDWVINAFNANLPFDRFTIEQLAGDLLPDATMAQKIATGFNRCNVTTSEGGVIPEEYYVHYTNDRVATVSTVWMGITMGCVICHEHKFDPFETKDFYQLFAFFNSLDGPVMDGNKQDTAPIIRVPTDRQRAESASLDKRIDELARVIAAPNAEVDRAQRAWETRLLASAGHKTNWVVLAPETFTSSGGATLTRLEDDSILAGGKNSAKEVYEIVARIESNDSTAIRLEGLLHESLTEGRAGRSGNGNVVLTEFEALVGRDSDGGEPASIPPQEWRPIKFAHAWADHEQTNGDFGITNAIDGKSETGWAVAGHERREDHTAIFRAESAFGSEDGTWLKVRLRHESKYGQHQFGRIRLAVTGDGDIPQLVAASTPADIIESIRIEPDKREQQQQRKIREHYRDKVSQDPKLRQAHADLATVRKEKTDLEKSLPTTLVWKEMAEAKPAFILTRGAYDKKGERVVRNTPAALPPMASLSEGEVPTRLHLARWLVAPEHPLTARVTVNRIWQQYFGTGIVETTEDFGSQGTPPSHPRLLDWLAVDFREGGWDVKRLHEKIVLSATYRQSSRITPEMIRKDPGNRLLARGPRFRIDAEMVRDNALALSGLLVPKIGGPSVKPYQPPGIWFAVGYTDSNTARFKRDDQEALYRRSMYTFWKRTAPPPTMVTFDAPSRENCTVRRSRTNTPQAALALMNDEQFVEASRGLAQRVMAEAGDSDQRRAAYGFRLATARAPSDAESAVLLDVYGSSLAKFRSDTEAASQLVAVGESKPDPKLDVASLAAWTMVANLILNLDETITKE